MSVRPWIGGDEDAYEDAWRDERDADSVLPLTGWERVDLGPVLAGEQVTSSPSLFRRTDGRPILYPAKVHSFNGEPESGKSWAALVATAEVILDGGVVFFLDFEDGPEGITERLLSLGLPAELLDSQRGPFWYQRLDQPFTVDAADVLDRGLAKARPTLCVVDGVTEAMTLLGLDPYDNAAVAKFWAALPRRLARTGAAVILIDHVVKDREGRGRWAIGAQHKMAAVDGAAFTFDVIKPFAREQEGRARLTITKDRPGHLRQHAVGGVIAELRITSWSDGRTEGRLLPATGGDGSFRPTVLMEKISRYIEDHPGISKNSVSVAVKGDDKAKRLAIEFLVAENYMALEVIARSHTLTSLNPYRNEEENQ